MSSRFSEIINAKWCKICSANVIDGQRHPDETAHAEAKLAEIKAAEQEYVLSQKMEARSSLIPVSSNDMLKHIAQEGSPESLCGRPITDKYRPSTTDLVCDTCATLASTTNFLVNSDDEEAANVVVGSNFEVEAVNYTRDGYKIADDGFTILTTEEKEFELFVPFTYERIVAASSFDSDFDDANIDNSSDDEIIYIDSLMNDEPIQFTAHWLEEDNEEEPLFLPNNDL